MTDPQAAATIAAAEQPLYTRFGPRLRALFGARARKVTVDAGFTCPNLDGTLAVGGCAFCNNASFSPPVRGGRARASVGEQLRARIAAHRARPRARPTVFIAYFQAYTNTYGEPARLRALWDEALAVEGVAGIAVGTRPDCVPEPVLDVLCEVAERAPVLLELGIQTANERTLRRLNRAHGVDAFVDAVARIRRREARLLRTSAHVILGLPGEGREDARATARLIARCAGIDAVKVHHFYVAPGSPLEREWRAGEVEPPTLERFVAEAADLLERIPRAIAVERLCGELSPRWALAPRWDAGKAEIARRIEDELRRRGTAQGALAGNGEAA